MKNKIIYIILASASVFSAQAQQEAHFTQFADNQLFVNPAYAASQW